MGATNKMIACALLALLVLAGCAAVKGVEPGSGATMVVEELKYDDLWIAVLQVMTKRFDIKEIDKGRGYLKAAPNHWGVGEFLVVFISPREGEPKHYQVEVISTRSRRDYHQWDMEVLAAIKGQIERKGRRE